MMTALRDVCVCRCPLGFRTKRELSEWCMTLPSSLNSGNIVWLRKSALQFVTPDRIERHGNKPMMFLNCIITASRNIIRHKALPDNFLSGHYQRLHAYYSGHNGSVLARQISHKKGQDYRVESIDSLSKISLNRFASTVFPDVNRTNIRILKKPRFLVRFHGRGI
jgi:hypothetical protein